MADPVVKYDRVTEKYVELMFPPYSWDVLSRLLDVINSFADPQAYMQEAYHYGRKLDVYRQRFEYYTSRMPFPREWFMFDFSVFRKVAVLPHDFIKSFFNYYREGSRVEHVYRPENFRSYVSDYISPVSWYLRAGGSYGRVGGDLRSVVYFVDKLYDMVVNKGQAQRVENRYGYADYEFLDYFFRVPNIRIPAGWLTVLLSYVGFYYFPYEDHVPVRFLYAPSYSVFVPGKYAVIFDLDFQRRYFNAPKSVRSTYVHWFMTPFYSISQPVYFDRRGYYVMGWYMDELTYDPVPPAKLGETFFLGTEFLRSFYHLYRFSKLVRYITYYAGFDKYPYPFDKIDLVEDDPVASLAFMFFLAHRLSFVDSATYRAQALTYWRSAKEVLMFLGYNDYFRPLNVFTGVRREYSPKNTVLNHYDYELLSKVANGVYLYPEVASWISSGD